jgi:hypothetical protein
MKVHLICKLDKKGGQNQQGHRAEIKLSDTVLLILLAAQQGHLSAHSEACSLRKLDPRDRKKGCLVMSSIIYTHRRALLICSNQGGYNGLGMYSGWARCSCKILFRNPVGRQRRCEDNIKMERK